MAGALSHGRRPAADGLTLNGRLAQASREHRAILDAIAGGDADEARAMMAEHVGNAAAAAEQYLAELG